MKTLVLYTSSTGFTQKYARWIGEALKAEVKEAKKIKQTDIEGYDCVIYGGWIMGNMIMGLDKIMKMNPKKLYVFAVGSSKEDENLIKTIKEQNKLGDTPTYYFEGGFKFDELGFFKRLMLNTIKKSVAKKENKTPQDLYMQEVLGTSFDHTNQEYITKLVDDIKKL